MTHLFLFTIGPVQGFIAQARKTRDLAAGSQLLSDLIRHAWEKTKEILGAENCTPITPYFDGPGLPNRFLLEVAVPDEKMNFAEAVSASVKLELITAGQKALKKKYIKEKTGDFDRFFLRQLEDQLEVHWVLNPIGPSDDYQQKYLETESLLGSVKATRHFEQLPEDEASRKCSVTGERDALVFAHRENKEGKKILPSKANAQVHATIKSDEIQMAENEGLSAIAFTKRFYRNITFPSTANVAIMEWRRMAKIYAPIELETLETITGRQSLGDDGQLFFEENHNEKYLKKQGYGSRAANFKKMTESLRAIEKLLKKHSIKKTPYYALIAFDGDRMGQWWSGNKSGTEGGDLKDFQVKLTRLLGDYAKWAKGYLEEPKGKAVYAGGDDFLGFINLQHLFPVLDTLREEFRKQVSDQTGVNTELTFSAGVAIAHYKTPLNVVLDTARMMEKKAKDEGRNRLGIKVLKHSGEAEAATLLWDEAPALKFITAELAEHVSDKFIGDLAQEMYRLTGREFLDQGGKSTLPSDLWRLEVKRMILNRKTEKTYNPDNLSGKIMQLFEARKRNPKELTDLLSVSKFIQRQTFILKAQNTQAV